MNLTDRINHALAGLLADHPAPARQRREQIRKGIAEEMEHAGTIKRVQRNPKMPIRKVAEAIAKDHLKEDPDYYDRLAAGTGKQAKTPGIKAPRLRLLMRIGKVRVYLVNATAVRKMTDKNPSAPDYTMATHWGVWPEIVPRFEIWVSDELGVPRPPLEMMLTILHEVAEARRMVQDGLSYDDAHNESLALEDKYRKAKGRGLKAALLAQVKYWRQR